MSDRYEPLPGFAELPGWLWRRTGTAVRIGVTATLVVAVAAAVVLVSSAGQSRERRAARQQREQAAQRVAAIRRLQAEQRPRHARSSATARPAMITDLAASILTDARRRVSEHQLRGPILRVACEPFPRTVGGTPPERDPSKREGRYACLAVTAEFGRSEGGEAGAIGHPYRALVRFDSGRYAYCKVSGRPDPVPDPAVTTPRECGGS